MTLSKIIESSMRVTTFHVGSLAVFYEDIRRLAYKAQQIDALNYKIWLKHQNKCESHQQHTATHSKSHNKHNGKEWVTVTDLRSAVIYQTPNDFSHYIRFQFSSRRHWKWISNHDRFSVLSARFRLAPRRQQRRGEVKEGNIVCCAELFWRCWNYSHYMQWKGSTGSHFWDTEYRLGRLSNSSSMFRRFSDTFFFYSDVCRRREIKIMIIIAIIWDKLPKIFNFVCLK